MTPENFDKYRDNVLRSAAYVGSRFKNPGDDWAPMLITFEPYTITMLIEWVTEENKAHLPTVLRQAFRESRPGFAAVVLSCWMAIIDADGPLASVSLDMMEQFGVGSHPDRKEILQVVFGDGDCFESWEAEVARHEDGPPTLGPWQKSEGMVVSGRAGYLLEYAFS